MKKWGIYYAIYSANKKRKLKKKSTFLVSKNCIINFLILKICITIVDQNKAYTVTNWNKIHPFGKKRGFGHNGVGKKVCKTGNFSDSYFFVNLLGFNDSNQG